MQLPIRKNVSMCNLYSITTNQAAIIALFRVMNRYVGNLPPMPGVFPDYPAPVVRNAGTERELTTMRWGMPPPPQLGGAPVTNIRNTTSPHWRGWLKPERRCLVPANSFSEYAPETNPETKKKNVVWFALNDGRPLFAFVGHSQNQIRPPCNDASLGPLAVCDGTLPPSVASDLALPGFGRAGSSGVRPPVIGRLSDDMPVLHSGGELRPLVGADSVAFYLCRFAERG
jgi:hypothetical protein